VRARRRYGITNDTDEPDRQLKANMKKSKRQIVCEVLGLNPAECSHGDREYVVEFERIYGELTEESFREHHDDADFTNWAIERGY
jgi:hypothetical protein